MSIGQTILRKLNEALDPEIIELRNDSDKHIGHAGHDGSGESHFTLLIVAEKLSGKSRLERHRLIHEIIGRDLGNKVHALSIGAYAPGEYPPSSE